MILPFITYQRADGSTKVERIELSEEGLPVGGVPSFMEVERRLFMRLISRLKSRM